MKFAKKTETCLGCKKPLTSAEEKHGAVGAECRPRFGELYTRSLSKVADVEVKFSRLWTQCQRCQGSMHNEVICSSRDCPIFYMRMKAKKDVEDAGKELDRFDTVSGFRPSEPDQRIAMVALGGRAQNRVRRCRTRRFGTEPVLLSVFPFLLLCQTGRRRVMGMNERVMGRERQEGERQETKRETMSMGRDSVGVQGEGVRPSSWAKGSTAQAGGVRCTVYVL
jgi:hypothetical protein